MPEFIALATASSNEIRATAQHYLYANGTLVQAKAVRVGDTLQLADGSLSIVVTISRSRASGLYSPYTMYGDVVVDGVRASCYSAHVDPLLAHALSWPLRVAHTMGFTLMASAPRQLAIVMDILYALMPTGA